MKKESTGRSQEVEEFVRLLKHSLKDEILFTRGIIQSADPELTEHIKWNAPSFCKNGEDRITFNLQGKGFFRLIFHRGAKVKDVQGNAYLIEDDTGLLEWASADRAIVKLGSREEIEAKKERLIQVIRKWLEAAG